jgi:excinuclease ABC subunit C
MEGHARAYEFEKAQAMKEKIILLERYQARSTIVNPKLGELDVFSIFESDDTAYVNFMKVAHGAVIQAHTVEMKKKLDETAAELLAFAVFDLRRKLASEAAEIIVPFEIDLELPGLVITVPKIGDKKHLLLLSEKNARYYQMEKEKQLDLVDPERKTKRIMETMMKDLRMKEPPLHIECFDNSNFQGDEAVSAMVCFKNGRPDKNEYRHYIVKTVSGPDDYATMQEVILRRYKRLLEESKPLPQLVVVDGGKGQLSAAVKSLEELGLRGKISIIGIAKKLEEIYYPDDPLPMYIDKKSETLRIIQRLRDEAHRFGITHHRKRREKATLKTELTEIRGIGEETAKKLLTDFKSVKNIKNATQEELEKSVGKSKGRVVFGFYHA